MWNEAKQQQLDDLQRQAMTDQISVAEQQMLDQLLHELEQDEWTALRPALDALRRGQGQLQADLGRIQAQNAILAALTARYEDLITRANVQLSSLMTERD